MSDRDRRLREALQQRLMAVGSKLPTSTLGRLGRTAMTALRGRRHLRGGDGGDDPPDLEGLAQVVASIGQLKGIAMKMGQIMSYIDVALPDDLRAALAVLQTHSPPMAFAQVVEIVTADLGDRAAGLLAALDPTPVAAASIGQVHRGRLADGRAVAVKVRYPDVEAAIASDFKPASFGSRMASLFYPGARVDAMIAEARARFLQECDYRQEAAAQQRFAAIYAGHPSLTVPAIDVDHCGPRVLTSAWIDGLGFEAYLATDPSAAERDRLGEALFEFYVGTLFVHGLYNCDPHPGNYLFQPDGRIAMLDYGCTREFEPGFVAALAGLTRAVHADDRDQLSAALVEVGLVREGRAHDFDNARTLVRSFFGPMLRDEVLAVEPGAARGLGSVLQRKRALMKLTLPGEFLFLFRIRFGVLSILARLGARANWYQLEQRYIARAGAAAQRVAP